MPWTNMMPKKPFWMNSRLKPKICFRTKWISCWNNLRCFLNLAPSFLANNASKHLAIATAFSRRRALCTCISSLNPSTTGFLQIQVVNTCSFINDVSFLLKLSFSRLSCLYQVFFFQTMEGVLVRHWKLHTAIRHQLVASFEFFYKRNPSFFRCNKTG